MRFNPCFSSSAGPREWRQGRFRVMGVPGPGPGDEVTRPLYSDVTARRLPSHVTLTASRQPDGVYFLTRCNGCGARIEDSPAAASGLARMDVEPFDAWLARHARCDSAPLVHEMSAALSALVTQLTQAAEHALSRGEMMPSHLVLLSEDGQVWAVPHRREGVYGNELDVDINLETAWLHTWLRRWQRDKRVRLEAALTIGEAWAWPCEADAGGAPPVPLEIVYGVVVTPNAGFFASSSVVRAGGTPGVGPGSFGGLQWMPLVYEAPIVDLLLAA